jgi:allophanate hydrolase
MAPAFSEGILCAIAGAMHFAHKPGLNLGASKTPVPPPPPAAALAGTETALFCIGAHMSGLPKNDQIVGRAGRFLRTANTEPHYRLYSFGEFPGMVESASGGISIPGEIWAIPRTQLGSLLADIPAPLSLGTVDLEDGPCIGFVCGATDAPGEEEITAAGGWRDYLASRGKR